MGKLDGKMALITGGSEGIGSDTAKQFLREGAFVFITGRRKPELDKAVKQLGHDAAGIQADAGKLEDLDRMYAEIRQKKGKLDIVFANAGIYEQMPYDKVTKDFYDKCADINFTAELKGVGPRSNVIGPGPIDTAGNASTLGSIKEVREFVTNMVPRSRIGQGGDIGKAAVFLACDDSSFVAGAELFVDGGMNAV